MLSPKILQRGHLFFNPLIQACQAISDRIFRYITGFSVKQILHIYFSSSSGIIVVFSLNII